MTRATRVEKDSQGKGRGVKAGWKMLKLNSLAPARAIKQEVRDELSPPYIYAICCCIFLHMSSVAGKGALELAAVLEELAAMLMQLEAKVVFGIHPMACTPGQMRCLGHTADASDSVRETSKEATSSGCASVAQAAKQILASMGSKC